MFKISFTYICTRAPHRVCMACTDTSICILRILYSKSLCDFIFSFRLIESISCAVRCEMTVKSSVAYITLPNVFAQGYVITTFTELNAIHITQIILFQPHTHAHVSHLNGSPCAQQKRKQFMAILMYAFFSTVAAAVINTIITTNANNHAKDRKKLNQFE